MGYGDIKLVLALSLLAANITEQLPRADSRLHIRLGIIPHQSTEEIPVWPFLCLGYALFIFTRTKKDNPLIPAVVTKTAQLVWHKLSDIQSRDAIRTVGLV
jgi:hypothetical protein